MRTGEFIKKQYEKEISRIMQELEIAKIDILSEQEILDLQSRVRAYALLQEGTLVVALKSGGVSLSMPSSKITSCNVFKKLWDYHINPDVLNSWTKPDHTFLLQMHIAELKKCHPKMAGQMLRQLAKQALLDNVEETTTKKWWEFWKK